MKRFGSAILFLISAAAILSAVPVPAYASIEVDEEEVIFRFVDTSAAKVFLTGDFNNWNPTMDSMVKRGGNWEVRLYLVPGRYRYAFVVDGKSVPDPDNPNRDTEGNTFFIFVEEDGVYKIVYEVTDTGERKIDEIYDPYGALAATAVEDYSLFTASAGVDGEIDRSLRGNFLIGAEYEPTAEDPMKAYLVRAKGEWVTDKFSLGAFHRSGRVSFDDPLSLFTDVGPYAYPLDLFCRGAEATAGWENSIEGRVFFANRIDGYRSWHERSLRYTRYYWNPVDKDMIGASLKGTIEPVKLEYLYRYDRGHGQSDWDEYGRSCYYSPETRTSHGLLLEIEKQDWPVFKAQYLSGKTKLEAHSIIVHPDSIMSVEGMSEYDKDWEEGYRAMAGISYSRGAFLGLFEWNRTTMERYPGLLDSLEYWDDATMDIFSIGFEYEAERLKIDLDLDFLDFGGSGGTGRTFWLQGWNFWLDGDMVRTELLQFLDSERMWRAVLSIEEGGADEIPGPYRLQGYLLAKANWDGETERSIFEISGGKGIRAGSYLSIHTDMRYVQYSDDRWVGESGFFDLWAGLRGNLGGSGWAALGVGVAPHRFDRWYFDFTGDGRESYLIDQFHLWWVEPGEEAAFIEELGKAEKILSEEWRLSFESGFSL